MTLKNDMQITMIMTKKDITTWYYVVMPFLSCIRPTVYPSILFGSTLNAHESTSVYKKLT